MTEKINPTNARQGVTGHRVKIVLLISILLALFALVSLNIYGEQTDGVQPPPTTTQQ